MSFEGNMYTVVFLISNWISDKTSWKTKGFRRGWEGDKGIRGASVGEVNKWEVCVCSVKWP